MFFTSSASEQCTECKGLLQAYRTLKKTHEELICLRDEALRRGISAALEELNRSLIDRADECEWARMALRYHRSTDHENDLVI